MSMLSMQWLICGGCIAPEPWNGRGSQASPYAQGQGAGSCGAHPGEHRSLSGRFSSHIPPLEQLTAVHAGLPPPAHPVQPVLRLQVRLQL